jgi:uncharacterized protein
VTALLLRVLVALLAVAMLVVYAAGWYYASEILTPATPPDPDHDIAVEAVSEHNVRLERRPDTERPGVWGLDWPDGYARIGPISDADEDSVSRALTVLDGTLEQWDQVSVDPVAYPADPAVAFFFPVYEVRIDGELGALPADLVWPTGPIADPEGRHAERRLRGPRDTWAVLVHGRGGTRADTYRLFPTLRDLGMPVLAISYRNDPDAPASPDGYYGLGATEWRDVAAATDYAFANGARDVVLVGFSMGGAIVANYLHESADADRVRGVVLDAPVLDWDVPLRQAARERRVPEQVVPVAKALATLRTGIRWSTLDHVARADEFDAPMLIFHGTDDSLVPPETSEAFAEARDDLVEYVPVDGAGHVAAWNADPDDYEARVRAYVLDLLD